MCLPSFLATCPRCGKAVETVASERVRLERSQGYLEGLEEALRIIGDECQKNGLAVKPVEAIRLAVKKERRV